jgi:predicted lactoylglutathione lyase
MGPGSPRLTAVTLGVRDVGASLRFYEALGFVRKLKATGDEIAFIDGGGVVLALWDRNKLAGDAGLPAGSGSPAFRGMTLAWNCRTREEVDAAYARGVAAGGKPLRPPEPTDYGGYRGYFSDPDGHAWEVVTAPGFGFTDDGRLVLPE